MEIKLVFAVKNQGTVVSGCIRTGTVTVGSTLMLTHGSSTVQVLVASIKRFRAPVEQAVAGDDVVIAIHTPKHKDVKGSDVGKGDWLLQQ